MQEYKTIEELKGKILTLIENTGIRYNEIIFTCSDGSRYQMAHVQDCCETVEISEIEGDLQNLIGSPIVIAREEPGHGEPAGYESVTFTDFILETETYSVTIHWTGSSNGYYNESVYFIQIDEPTA